MLKSANLAVKFLLELAVFGLAAGALAAAGAVTLAIIFGAVVVLNSVLLSVFHQWEQ